MTEDENSSRRETKLNSRTRSKPDATGTEAECARARPREDGRLSLADDDDDDMVAVGVCEVRPAVTAPFIGSVLARDSDKPSDGGLADKAVEVTCALAAASRCQKEIT